ncbi:hypothetical protein ACSNOH_14675 [Streptomyces sp. URMC 127]
MTTPAQPADLFRHSLRLLLDKNIPARDYWNPLAVLQDDAADFARSSR